MIKSSLRVRRSRAWQSRRIPALIFALFFGFCGNLAAENPSDSLDSAKIVESDSTKSADSTALLNTATIADSSDSAESIEIADSASPQNAEIPDPEFPDYDDSNFLQSLVDRFSLHHENYFLPIYYQTKMPTSPHEKPFKKYEVKLQISAKASIFKDLFWGVGAYFAYTQKSFFQIYSFDISSPFRSNDYNPEIILYKAFPLGFNVRLGYRHLSNGETGELSRGVDLVAFDVAYNYEDFRATLKLWAYLRGDPRDLKQYLGYGDLVLEYRFLERNHLRLTLANVFHNYAKYKGSVKLEYRFDIRHFGIFVQYFYGYGDNLIEYKLKKHALGVGFAIARF